MTMAISPLQTVPMPPRIATLPRDHRGYPVPFFVQWMNGKPEFPIFDPHKWRRCVDHKLCWICGQRLGRHLAYAVGPMCTINRVSSEPAQHRECAEYALRVCPFLINPAMRRVPTEKYGSVTPPGGIMDERNPGVMALWVTPSFSILRTPNGPIISMGDPERVDWFTRGRAATATEAAEAFKVGAAKLLVHAEREAGEAGIVELVRLLIPARKLLPDPALLDEVSG
jgi:hypothetical protein